MKDNEPFQVAIWHHPGQEDVLKITFSIPIFFQTKSLPCYPHIYLQEFVLIFTVSTSCSTNFTEGLYGVKSSQQKNKINNCETDNISSFWSEMPVAHAISQMLICKNLSFAHSCVPNPKLPCLQILIHHTSDWKPEPNSKQTCHLLNLFFYSPWPRLA